ncbi:hypothetical protein [Streptomyces pratensis]|uniref:hypothetical protein n=1 Tax=Streptomyces pratensis TaxID=1169025 RepID=UPI003016C6A9
MSVSPRRTTLRLLAAVACGTLVLTGCGGKGQEPADDSAAVAATGAPSSGGGTAALSGGGGGSQDAPTSPGKAAWAGAKRFVTIDRAWTEGGLTHLSVRPAQKKARPQFDTWEVVPGTGAFTTVTLAEDARVLLTSPVRGEGPSDAGKGEPVPSSHTEFVALLKQLDSGLSAGIGYDLSFDGEGRVARLQSQYKP